MSALENIKARTEGHTEGPWEADHTDPGVWSQEHIVIGQYTANDGFDSQMWEDGTKADRELLAAAPKLLAALEAVESLHVREVLAVHEGYGVEAWCPPCREHWPCPTVAAITEALA